MNLELRKDLVPPIFFACHAELPRCGRQLDRPTAPATQSYVVGPLFNGGLSSNRLDTGGMESHCRWSSMDSDLEAFNHNPTDGSFASLAVQPNAKTNYLNQRFLSY